MGPGHAEVLPQPSGEVGIPDLQEVGVGAVLVVGRVFKVLDGVGGSPVLLPLSLLRLLHLHLGLLLLARRVDHAGRVSEGSGQGTALEQEVAGGVCDPLLEADVVVPQSLSADLVLLRDLNAGLLQDLEPGVSSGLADAHTLLRFVDQQVGHKVLGLAGNVLPQLKVEVNISHLDTLEGLSVVLTSEGGHSGKEEVGDDAARPHVGGEGGSFSVDNLRSDVLRLPVLQLDNTDNTLGEREVADLDLVTTKNMISKTGNFNCLLIFSIFFENLTVDVDTYPGRVKRMSQGVRPR